MYKIQFLIFTFYSVNRADLLNLNLTMSLHISSLAL